jgi:organic radical activating enzyme
VNNETYKDININLTKNGIFPILYDRDGNNLLETNNETSEIKYPKQPGTVINEGKLSGLSCIYIRFSGCNLHCCWLDTEYKSDPCDVWKEIQYENKQSTSLYDILNTVSNNTQTIKRVVITGGEPTLQLKELNLLLQELKQMDLYTVLETNGTIYNPDMLDYVDFLSISAKLSNTTPTKAALKNTDIEYNETVEFVHNKYRIDIRLIAMYCDYFINIKKCHDFEVKFTVNSMRDFEEINIEYLPYLTFINNDDIVIVPQGTDSDMLKKSSKVIFNMCIKNDWRYYPRIHYNIFDDGKNVW